MRGEAEPLPPRKEKEEKRIPTDLPPPQRPLSLDTRESWSVVAGWKGKNKGVGNPPSKGKEKESSAGRNGAPSADQKEKRVTGKRKLPTTAAVTIAAKKGGYGEIIKTARKEIGENALKEMGIGELRTRKTMAGAYILEIPRKTREEREAKAEALACRLEAVFRGNEEIKISRPLKMAQIRIRDLDESVDSDDIVQAVVTNGGGAPHSIKVGRTATAPNGMGAVIVQCPLAIANRVVKKKRITVGWAACRVSMMEHRPLQCFKCLELGHVQQNCKGTVDRSSNCYRCGEEVHIAATCRANPQCLVCKQAGRPANHRIGAQCRAQLPKKGMEKRGGLRKDREGKNPPPLKVKAAPEKPQAEANVNPALGPMGGRFSPTGEVTPGKKPESQAATPMELDSLSPPLPQRQRLRRRPRVTRDEDSVAVPEGDADKGQGEEEAPI